MDVEPRVDLRRAELYDAERLAAFAARTFADTFAADNTAEDLALHTARSYGAALQRAEIADPDVRTLIAEHEGDLVAYAQVRRGPPPSCVTAAAPVELWRFYVDRAWIGRGLAQRLMTTVLAEAEALGGQTLWLGVWERNARARAFYRKHGFEDVGSHVYWVGNDPQTDRIVQRSIGARRGIVAP